MLNLHAVIYSLIQGGWLATPSTPPGSAPGTMHSSWTYSVLLCVPFIFADSESVDLAIVHDGFPS